MYTLELKPISVNEAYKGRKWMTDKHREFKKVAAILLSRMDFPKLKEKEPFYIIYHFYTDASVDIDNMVKVVQDCITQCLGTDDRYIYGLYIEKHKIKRGNERIEFNIFQDKQDFKNHV